MDFSTLIIYHAAMDTPTPNKDQQAALDIMNGPGNIFLTGEAGTGKSFVLRHFIEQSEMQIDVLATTGAAAMIIDGRTFHSFFCLYKFDAGYHEMVNAAMKNYKMCERVKHAECIVIDEISMLDQKTMAAGEEIARKTRGNDSPWGGLKVIAVGDFLQLPPVDINRKPGSDTPVSWVFESEAWQLSNFKNCRLNEVVRTEDPAYLEVLQKIRIGVCDDQVQEFMNSRMVSEEEAQKVQGTRLFPVRAWVDTYNHDRLHELKGDILSFKTEYSGFDDAITKVKRNAPFRENIILKPEALIMIRENDPQGYPYRYVNGSLGYFKEVKNGSLVVELMTGETVELEKREFHSRDGDGKIVATAINYPMCLAYASTIHKAQGATLDKAVVNLGFLWEPGQAYVALSRTRKASDLFIAKWHPKSIFADNTVKQFYSSL